MLFAVALVTMGVASPAFADDATGTVTTGSITIEHEGKPTGVTYNDIKTATTAAKSGDTIKLGEGNYTLYGVDSVGTTKGKDLTFEGAGADKTSWRIGREVPDPDYKGERNGDYSFDGAGTVTFKNMRLRSAEKAVDYQGFIRIDNTVVNNCVIDGKTFYWGYKTATFTNTTFNAPSGDYAIWTYSSPVMTFDTCTFNATGKVINVYTDFGAGKNDIIVNVNNCAFNSTKAAPGAKKHKQALKINDSNMKGYKYILNITGINTGNTTVTAERDDITCSQLFGFGGETVNNSGRTDVTIDGVKVWSEGKMVTHDYTDGEHDKAYDVTYTNWTPAGAGTWTRTGTPKCKYCGFVNPDFVETAYDLSYDLNGSENEKTAAFDTVQHVTEANVTAEQPVRKGYSFVGWNTAKDGSGTSYAAGDKVELTAPVTLYAQWKKDEPAPKPSDNKPADKPAKKSKSGKKALPMTGDASANVVAAMSMMAIVCFAASVVVAKVRK